ncbi:GNAT family N-acetyltransferase [Paenibacillus albidus]|uniref:GNAT family N-acetyltransferase n=1 Tax=Paenibacillus albidus TaxID=2041023 RepID=UPI001BEB6A4F|nr:GNAT family N-acetyltransferase [Paenibacillus albidus]MBT2292961.1 GNAT family N-acetyltransferase [Paenibacillus albidus]
MILFQAQELCLRSLEPADAGVLVQWLSDPGVLEFYEGRDRPHDMDKVLENFYPDQDEHGLTRCIIEYHSQAIGYLQFYPIDEEELGIYGYQEYAGRIYGMDQFIGETEYWNRGLGSQLIRETVAYLIEQKNASKIVMDPQAWNARALRVYEKNGFVKKKLLEKHEWHEGEYRDCWLIEYDRKANSTET